MAANSVRTIAKAYISPGESLIANDNLDKDTVELLRPVVVVQDDTDLGLESAKSNSAIEKNETQSPGLLKITAIKT